MLRPCLSLFSALLAASLAAGAPSDPSTPQAKPNFERRITEALNTDPQTALPLLEQWRAAKGEKEAQYWWAGAQVWLALAETGGPEGATGSAQAPEPHATPD